MFTIGVLASGKGSNLQAIVNSIKSGFLNIKIGVVISDNPEAFALEIARSNGIDAVYIEPGKYKNFINKDYEKNFFYLNSIFFYFYAIKRTNFPKKRVYFCL